MSTIQQGLEKSNAQYAAQFTKGHLALPPARKYLVLTCMDARIDPASAFGIELGDAHVIRNAGASARDALRSIIISEQLLGTREIILVSSDNGRSRGAATACGHWGGSWRAAEALETDRCADMHPPKVKHTGCGMLTFQNDDAHGIVKKNLGGAAAKEVEHVDFLPFADLEQAVRDDIVFLKGTETVPKDVVVSGWVYEVETGKVMRVD